MRPILVAGAINTDLVASVERAPAAGETVTGHSFVIFGGGKGANQAVAARRAGANVALLGAVGSDDFGAARLAELRAEGIDLESVAVRDGIASGVALITVEAGGENRIAYIPGTTLTLTVDDAVDAFRRVDPGILLATLELPLGALEALFRIAHELGRQTILCATPEPERAQPLLPDTDVLVVNRGEAAALLGTSAEDRDLLQRLMHVGPSNVLLTLGNDGVAALVADELVRQPAFDVDVVDTTGAGDAFTGALAASLAEGRSMMDALRRGLAAGGWAVTKEGAQASMPHREAIEAMVRRLEDTMNAESD
jgi:ribokinase